MIFINGHLRVRVSTLIQLIGALVEVVMLLRRSTWDTDCMQLLSADCK